MPSKGILLETHHVSWRATTSLYGMQQEQSGTDEGAWIDARAIKGGALEVFNDAGVGSVSAFGVTVMGSNVKTIPDNSVDGATIQTVSGSNSDLPSIVALAGLSRWIKVKITSLTVTGGATLGVHLQAHNY